MVFSYDPEIWDELAERDPLPEGVCFEYPTRKKLWGIVEPLLIDFPTHVEMIRLMLRRYEFESTVEDLCDYSNWKIQTRFATHRKFCENLHPIFFSVLVYSKIDFPYRLVLRVVNDNLPVCGDEVHCVLEVRCHSEMENYWLDLLEINFGDESWDKKPENIMKNL